MDTNTSFISFVTLRRRFTLVERERLPGHIFCDHSFVFECRQNPFQVCFLSERVDFRLGQRVFFLGPAEFADQPLRNDDIYRRNDEERLRTHVDETRNGPG